jgi:hypothetical protein
VRRFITRDRPGDRDLRKQIFGEALRCVQDSVPTSQAVERLIAIAGDNPTAFKEVGGGDRVLTRSEDGQAAIRLIGAAATTKTTRDEGAGRFLRHRRSPEESALGSVPVAEAFGPLAAEEPRLRDAEGEVERAAERARLEGKDEAGVRSVVDEIVARVTYYEPVIGQSAVNPKGLCSTKTALFVVVEHLYRVAGITAGDFNGRPGRPVL